jgi:replicative DNA helicase
MERSYRFLHFPVYPIPYTLMANLRIPPQSIDAERALLGSIMLKPDAIHEVSDIVSTDSFYVEKHRLIFRSFIDLAASGSPIDLLSTSNRLKEMNEIERAGGNGYLAELVSAVPTAANIKYYAEIVQKKAMMRGIIEAAAEITEIGFDESRAIEEIVDSAEKRLGEVTSSPTMRKFVAIGDELKAAWERFDNLSKGDHEMRGIPSGFPALDNLLAGFQRSDLIILAARPSVGKTALALDIARQTAIKHGTPVGIFSLEMSSQQLVDRMLAAEARVDAWKLRTGKIDSDDEFERIRDGMERLSKAPIYIDDQPANNALVMRSVARRLKREHGIGLLIVDYLQLMTSTSNRQSDSLVQQVTEISRSLKILARELDVPVIALSQLSRAIEQRRGRPRLSDLRDSGSIEQDADVVMFIHNEDRYKEDGEEKSNVVEILVEKHRNGPTGKVDLYFDAKRVTYLPVDKSDFGNIGVSASADDTF